MLIFYLQDDMCLLESNLLLSHTKIQNPEASNKTLHVELARMREELKSAKEAQKAAEDAVQAKEQEHQTRLQIMEKALNDNLDAVAKSISGLAIDMFGKSWLQ
jgi:predicted Holliday junction resolvase-like endonuclease